MSVLTNEALGEAIVELISTAGDNGTTGSDIRAILTHISDSMVNRTDDSGMFADSPSDVGLGNVDNTSDVNKPVSSAMQTALEGKASLSDGLDGEVGKVKDAHIPAKTINAEFYNTSGEFPVTGRTNCIYVATVTETLHRWNGTNYVGIGGSLTPDSGWSSEFIHGVKTGFDADALDYSSSVDIKKVGQAVAAIANALKTIGIFTI